jgi:hypothetical protein
MIFNRSKPRPIIDLPNFKVDSVPLRVLHIGNVANYAYNIAKCLQNSSLKSDAIGWDYYHINAQPIWEEAEFDPADIGDHFFPKMPAASETGFIAPDWYFHGPRALACLALIAQNEDKLWRARLLRFASDRYVAALADPEFRASGRDLRYARLMEAIGYDLVGGFGRRNTLGLIAREIRRGFKGDSADPSGTEPDGRACRTRSQIFGPQVRLKWLTRALRLKWMVLNAIARVKWAVLNRADRLKWTILNRMETLKWKWIAFSHRIDPDGGARPITFKNIIRAVWIASGRPFLRLAAGLKEAVKPSANNTHASIECQPNMQLSAAADGRPIAAGVRDHVQIESDKCEQGAAANADNLTVPETGLALSARVETFEARAERLIAQYQELYPDRTFDPMLLRQYASTMPLMERLFTSYDMIIGYAIEGIWPLMAGKPYVAYEFGTIRNLPFEDSSSGRLAALVYRNCDQIIVTNCDNEKSAKVLQRPYFFLPHVINERFDCSAEAGVALREQLVAQHGGDFYVFHPARQHWSEVRDTNWDKGNDHLFHGFAALVRARAPNARCIAVAWGQTLEQSKDLVESLGIAANVIWITPQTHVSMMKYIAACDVVADQFTIPTFGGIPPKAFFLGKPVITSFDKALHQWCFAQMPPLIPASTAETVTEALLTIYTDTDYARSVSINGRAWYDTYNSNARVQEVLLSNLYTG